MTVLTFFRSDFWCVFLGSMADKIYYFILENAHIVVLLDPFHNVVFSSPEAIILDKRMMD